MSEDETLWPVEIVLVLSSLSNIFFLFSIILAVFLQGFSIIVRKCIILVKVSASKRTSLKGIASSITQDGKCPITFHT